MEEDGFEDREDVKGETMRWSFVLVADEAVVLRASGAVTFIVGFVAVCERDVEDFLLAPQARSFESASDTPPSDFFGRGILAQS